jgi:hypothetical protein
MTSYGNRAYGAAQSTTTYTPGTNYVLNHTKSQAGALVLRHVPGLTALRAEVLTLPDNLIGEFLASQQSMENLELSSDEYYAMLFQRLERLKAFASRGASVSH